MKRSQILLLSLFFGLGLGQAVAQAGDFCRKGGDPSVPPAITKELSAAIKNKAREAGAREVIAIAKRPGSGLEIASILLDDQKLGLERILSYVIVARATGCTMAEMNFFPDNRKF